MNKLMNSFQNGVWQMMPSVFTLLLSLAVVRIFDTSVWGNIVAVLVVQQIANSVISWGNKDFLQREIALNSPNFSQRFTTLFIERFLIFVLLIPVIYFCGLIELKFFIAFLLLVFGRFLQQSFDIIIIKERKFTLAILLEIVFLPLQLAAMIALFHSEKNDALTLLGVFWFPALLKGLILTLYFRKYFAFSKSKKLLLPDAFFFAMLSISGLVHSKIDVVLMSQLLPKETLGKYQIIMAFLWNIQSAAMYVSTPYIHNFYRLNSTSQRNYAVLLRRLGMLVVPVGVAMMALLLRFAFDIQIGLRIIIASVLFGAVSFFYLPWIFRMNQQKQEYKILLINIIGTFVLVGFILAAHKICGLTLERVVWIVTIQQLFITVIAFAANPKPKVCLQS